MSEPVTTPFSPAASALSKRNIQGETKIHAPNATPSQSFRRSLWSFVVFDEWRAASPRTSHSQPGFL
jgi:hypothetical protein